MFDANYINTWFVCHAGKGGDCSTLDGVLPVVVSSDQRRNRLSACLRKVMSNRCSTGSDSVDQVTCFPDFQTLWENCWVCLLRVSSRNCSQPEQPNKK
ncbi:hypothetical protein BaRGS_00013058, partial [Batillaria attramentaria]